MSNQENTYNTIIDEDIDSTIAGRSTRNAALVLLRIGAGNLLGIVAIFVLSKHLSTDNYGLYAIVASVPSSIYLFITAPFIWILLRQVKSLDLSDVRSASTTVLIINLTIGIIGGIFASIFTDISYGVITAMSVYLVLTTLSFSPTVTLQRNLYTAKTSLITFADRATLQIVAICLILLGTQLNLTLIIMLISAAIASVVVARMLDRKAGWFGSPRKSLQNIKSYSAPFIVQGSKILLASLLIPVTAMLASLHESGIFAWALSITLVPVAATGALAGTLFSPFARAEDQTARYGAVLASRVITVVTSLATLALLLLIPLLIGSVFPVRWEDALSTLMIMGISCMILSSTVVTEMTWAARLGMQRAATAQITALIIAVVLLVIITPLWGAEGSALAHLAASITLYICLHIKDPWISIKQLLRNSILLILPSILTAIYLLISMPYIDVNQQENILFMTLAFLGTAISTIALDRGQIIKDFKTLLRAARSDSR